MSRSSRVALLAASVLAAPPVAGEGFSIDAASPSVSAGSNSAILSAGPVGGPPQVEVTPGALGLAGGGVDDIDAISFGAGAPGLTFHFSVDRASVGLAGDVVGEAAAGQASGDVYASDLAGDNTLVRNQRGLGLLPAVTAGTPTSDAVDDLDAFDFAYDGAGTQIVYAMEPGHSLVGSAVGCGGDLFMSGSLFLSYSILGLGSCLDDVDALEVDTTTNTFYYSLAPGSPSLSPGSPISGCDAGCGPADLFRARPGMPAILFAPAADLGLQPGDDVDALSLAESPPPVPVPGLAGWGGAALAALLLASASRAPARA